MQRLATVALAPTAKSANNIATSQKPAAGGVQALNINGAAAAGGVATLDIARRVGITSSADDTGRTFTVTGTDRNGRVQSEALVGPGLGLTVSTLKDYKTVTSITVDANTAGNITVGTTDVASSQWLPTDRVSVKSVTCGVRAPAGTNWTVEYTVQDPFTPGVGVNPQSDFYLQPYSTADLTGKTGSLAGVIDFPVTAVRLTVNNGGAAACDFAPGFALLQ